MAMILYNYCNSFIVKFQSIKITLCHLRSGVLIIIKIYSIDIVCCNAILQNKAYRPSTIIQIIITVSFKWFWIRIRLNEVNARCRLASEVCIRNFLTISWVLGLVNKSAQNICEKPNANCFIHSM